MTLEPDSPTISDWLDGRLPAEEADAVAAAVRANPSLADVAAELRQLKELLTTAGDQPVEASPSLTLAVMSAITGREPGNEDPFTETDEEVDEAVAEEWQHVEQDRLDQERAEALEDEEATSEARRTEGPSAGSDRRWLKPAMTLALAAGLLVAVMLNLGDPPAVDAPPGRGPRARSVEVAERPEIDPVALAERMIARGIELTEGRQSMGTLHMTVHLGDREGRRQFEELLARSRVRLDREETMEGGRVERIGCFGRAAEVDRLLETLSVSSGSVVVQAGSLSREAIERLERRGPVAEPMLAAADAKVEMATDLQPPPEALASGQAAMPRAMRRAADPAPPADVAAVTLPVAEAAATPEEAAPSIAALAQADTPLPQARSLGSRSAQLAVPEAAGIAAAPAEAAPQVAMTLKMAAPTAATNDVPPPPKLIPPEGYVRLWIDIVDTAKSATTGPSAEGTSP
jgi:hypothetical protein